MTTSTFRKFVFAGALAIAAVACGDPEARRVSHVTRGDQFAAEGKYREATVEYRSALQIDPLRGEVRFKLAESYMAAGELPRAASEYVRAADLLPGNAEAQVKAATILLGRGSVEDAQTRARAALNADPKNVDAMIVLANAMAGLEDVAGGLAQLEEALAIAPDSDRTLMAIGGLEMRQGSLERSEAAFKKAIAAAPDSARPRVALAHFYWSSDRLADAEQELGQALAMSPDDVLANRMLAGLYVSTGRAALAEAPLERLADTGAPAARLSLANLYAGMKRIDEARRLYEQLAAEANAPVGASLRLAELEYQQGKREAANARIDQLLKRNPVPAEALVVRSRWLLQEKRFDEAYDAALNATRADTTSAPAQYALGTVALARQDEAAAIAAFRQTLRLNPRAGVANVQLSMLLLDTGEVTSALSAAEAGREALPRSLNARAALIAALMRNGDLRRADAESASLLRQAPDSSVAHALRGRTYLARGDASAAIRSFDTALALSPSNLDALAGRLSADVHAGALKEGRARLARALRDAPSNAALLLIAARFEISARDIAAAERHLRSAIEADANHFDAYSLLGQIYVRQQRLDRAKAEFEQLASRQRDPTAARTMIGIILDTQGKHAESRRVYQQLVASSSPPPVAANNLAYNYAEAGEELHAALDLAKSAIAQMPERAEAYHTLGWVYLKQDLPSLAIGPLRRSIELNADNAVYHYHLGLAHARANQNDLALVALERALSLSASFSGAADARGMVARLKART